MNIYITCLCGNVIVTSSNSIAICNSCGIRVETKVSLGTVNIKMFYPGDLLKKLSPPESDSIPT